MESIRQEILTFFGNTKNRVFIYVIFAVISLVAIGAAVLLITSTPKIPTLSKEEEKAVIDEIVKNNPSNILEETIKNNQPTYTPPETSNLGTPSQTPDLTKYNYRKTEYTYSKGPAYNVCRLNQNMAGGPGSSLVSFFEGEYKFTTTEYFELNKSIYKNIVSSDKSNLFRFSLSEYSNEKSQTYEYAGGDYAVKAVYEAYPGYTQDEYIQYPASYTNNYTNESYYNFIGEEKVNGRDTYIIQSEYYDFCNGGYGQLIINPAEEPNIVKVVTISNADKITYSIVKTRMYLNNTNASNLISQTDSTVKTSLVNSKDVASEFKFNYEVPVKTLDYSGYWNMFNSNVVQNNAKQYLSSSQMDLLVDNRYIISDIYVPNSYPKLANSEYYTDRKFYPSSVQGDAYYDYIINNDYISPEATIAMYRRIYYDQSYYLNIDIYPLGVSKNDIISQILEPKHFGDSMSQTFVKIDGENEAVTKLSITYKYYQLPTSYNAVPSFPISYPIYEWTDEVYLMERDSRVYKFSSTEDITNLNLDSYDTLNTNKLDDFFSMILGYNYYFPTSYSSYPVSYTGYY